MEYTVHRLITKRDGIDVNVKGFTFEKLLENDSKSYWVCALRQNNKYKCKTIFVTKLNDAKQHEIISKHIQSHNHDRNAFREQVPIHPHLAPIIPIMLRSGAGHPDAGQSVASTSRQRSPEEEAHRMYATLNEYLLLEHKAQPKLCLPTEAENGEATTGARDGAAHVLRCLKVWFDLPADVLIDAINLFDRFLTKMKVRPCHIPCITVTCMYTALNDYAIHTGTKHGISVEELVSISQSACTAGDVLRMSPVIKGKLSLVPGCRATTALDWLRLFRAMLSLHAQQCGIILPPSCNEEELVKLLEIVSCDAECVNARTSELALVLLYYKIDQELAESLAAAEESGAIPDHAYYLYDFARQLQLHCNMCDTLLAQARARVRHVATRYERCGARRDLRQRLVWRLSERTLKVLRPTDRLTSLLPTIEEQHFVVDATPTRTRSGSESSENEETSDWPRSPVLPVYCDN